ncbi:MAG: peroxidase family protein [Pirellulales bacterium]
MSQRRSRSPYARSQRNRRPSSRRPALERLEGRELCAVDFRSLDGVGNNLANPQWGSTEEAFLRIAPAEYADGASAPAGADRPSARAVSNALAAQGDADIPNSRNLSAFIYAWGQFLDHDIDLTDSAVPSESFPITVPDGDPQFDPQGTGAAVIPLSRSIYDATTGTSAANPRQQTNAISAFVDASQIYGSDATRAAALRTFSGGQMKTSDGDLLPYNTADLPNAAIPGVPADQFFVAGDVRANENVELLALHTLFVREHNRTAKGLAAANPTWNDEKLYQEARRIVTAEVQAITYNEFIPALVGANALKPYQGYRANVNPGISNEFATAAFRLGHSLLGSDIEFLDNQGNEVHDPVALRDAFFNVDLLEETGIDPILKYLASDNAQEIDVKVIDDVRNFLFGPPGAGGLDLAALNIQRGRDHGLADYNAVRVAFGLRPVTKFSEITRDPALQTLLRDTYGSVNNIDLWVGGLAEDHVPGASVGPTFQRILTEQFQRLRDGDRYWYEREFRGVELKQIRSTTLADVIRRNTETTNLQDNVFFFNVELSGRVVNDANGNGRFDARELGIANSIVQLLDARGVVVASTRTAADGSYRFTGLSLGTYRVQVVAPTGFRQTTPELPSIAVSKARTIDRLDIGLTNLVARPSAGVAVRGSRI